MRRYSEYPLYSIGPHEAIRVIEWHCPFCIDDSAGLYPVGWLVREPLEYPLDPEQHARVEMTADEHLLTAHGVTEESAW